ncbi:MAG: arylsulfatase [Pseudomonadales bacterium]
MATCSSVDGLIPKTKRPNVLLIVVDDVGFAELGAFGSEIPTPNIDALANSGIKLTNFHTAPTCSPTRSMLLSGVDSHIAGLGNMFEELSPNQKGQPGYEGYLHERVAPLPAIFKESGYRTYMAGKWHLGLEQGQGPTDRGFDRAFAILQGGAGHFGDMAALFHNEPGSLGKAKYSNDGELLEELPDNFKYSSEFYVDQMLEYLSEGEQEEPFFAYLSFTAPHWPLQAPAETIAKYKGKFDEGYEQVAERRLARQIQLGLIPELAKLSARPDDAPAWDSLSAEQRDISARAKEIYAAMLDEVDSHTGRLLDHLRSTGELDNTIVVFMSDNGSEGHDIDGLFPEEHFPKAREWLLASHKFDLESMGGPGSYVLYGQGWGWAAAPAFRGYKAYVTQGGTRVPAFVHYPKLMQTENAISNALLSVKDVAPTLLELTNIKQPGDNFKGQEVVRMTGASFAPVLEGEPYDTSNRILGLELFGKRSIRHGEWTLVEMFEPQGTGEWQMYYLGIDLAERFDVSDQFPEQFDAMKAMWEQYAEENGVIIPDWNSGY